MGEDKRCRWCQRLESEVRPEEDFCCTYAEVVHWKELASKLAEEVTILEEETRLLRGLP